MKYSINWIQKHIVEPLPSVEVIEQKIIFHAFEVEEIESVGDDTVMEIKVLPDRAGDALSQYGMAREIAGLFALTLKPLETENTFSIETPSDVRVESALCNRYAAIKMEAVTVTESPLWLQTMLSVIGQKSINAVVDATNYVLNDLGQPTHVFDADKVVGTLTVRMAQGGETITTLSDEEKILTETDLVIADDVGVLAIAGVKGGKRAEVTHETKSVILEIANFDAVSVRKTSRRLGLITDASKRFENNLSPSVVANASTNLVALIKELSGGEVVSASDIYQNKQSERIVTFSLEDIIRMLGGSVSQVSASEVFDRYGYTYEWSGDVCSLTVPQYRQDINGVHDIVEEVGRVIGYETIVPTALPFAPVREHNDVDAKIQSIKKHFVSEGFSEVMNYSFRKKGEVYVAHAPKDKSALRTNLSDGLKESFEMNRLNAPLLGLTEVKLFEIGTVFRLIADEIEQVVHVGLATKSGVEEYTLDECIERYGVNSADTDLENFETVPQPFRMWGAQPFMVRDIAVWLPSEDGAAESALAKVMHSFEAIEVIRPATLFDSFSKEGRTSYAYRIIFQAHDRTLTDDEVADLLAPLYERIQSIPGAELR